MTKPAIDINQLSISEKILLAEELWDSVATQAESQAITTAQKQILDERLASYKNSPEQGSSWEAIKNKL